MEIKATTIIAAVLIILIIVIASIYGYIYIDKKINDYITKKQIEAKDATLYVIIQQIQEKGYIIIKDGSENEIMLIQASLEKPLLPNSSSSS